MLKATRHKEILAAVANGGSAEVNVLAEKFKISPITIRRDLIELQEKGLLARIHGGAVAGELLADSWAKYESVGYEERSKAHAAEKKNIAELAAQLVNDGDCILINGGTTTHLFAETLNAHKNLHVITNGLTVAIALSRSQNSSVYMLPGVLDFKKMTSVCRPDMSIFKDITVKTAFLGVHSVNLKTGIAMLSQEEAMMNRAFIDAAENVTVLIDSSKFSAQAIFKIAQMDRIDRIVTDHGITDDTKEQLLKLGVEVLIATEN